MGTRLGAAISSSQFEKVFRNVKQLSVKEQLTLAKLLLESVLETVPDAQDEWPVGFFEATAGKWVGEPLAREPMGEYEMPVTWVANMSVDELKLLIQETVTQTLMELFNDPDAGLELREDFKLLLQKSLTTVQTTGKTIPADDVAARLGLSW